MEDGDFKVVLEDLRAQFKVFGDSLHLTNGNVASLRDELRVSHEKIDAKIWVLQADVTELKTDVADLKTDVADLKTDVADLTTDVADLTTDVADLKIDVTDVKKRVTRIESTLNGGRPRARRKTTK